MWFKALLFRPSTCLPSTTFWPISSLILVESKVNWETVGEVSAAKSLWLEIKTAFRLFAAQTPALDQGGCCGKRKVWLSDYCVISSEWQVTLLSLEDGTAFLRSRAVVPSLQRGFDTFPVTNELSCFVLLSPSLPFVFLWRLWVSGSFFGNVAVEN